MTLPLAGRDRRPVLPESVERLGRRSRRRAAQMDARGRGREEKKKSLYDIIELACAFFEEQLLARAGTEAREYLKTRGLTGEVAKKFRLGYAPDSNSALRDHLTARNVTIDDMVEAGLVRPASEDRSPARFLLRPADVPDRRCARAASSPSAAGASRPMPSRNTSTPARRRSFPRASSFTISPPPAPPAIKAQCIVVAEGYMDVIALVRAGFDYAVAPLGTALTEDQLHILWRIAPEPILAFDGDDAGLKAAHRAARLALPHLKAGTSLRFAFLPSGEDPDSFLRASGPAAMKKLLDEALPLSRCCGRWRPRARISRRPSAAPGWSGRWPMWSPPSAMARSPTTTAAISSRRCSRRSNAAPPRPNASGSRPNAGTTAAARGPAPHWARAKRCPRRSRPASLPAPAGPGRAG
ncbi:MAG: toprim domain-containing protein [Rhizomicrobium sp.]